MTKPFDEQATEASTRTNEEELAGVSRRDALKLASALSALGAGLGVTLGTSDAAAAPPAPGLPVTPVTPVAPIAPVPLAAAAAKLAVAKLGQLTVKLYKERKDGEPTLVHSFDLGALSHKWSKDVAGTYTIKLSNVKMDLDGVKAGRVDVLAEQSLEVVAVAPTK